MYDKNEINVKQVLGHTVQIEIKMFILKRVNPVSDEENISKYLP